MRLEIGMTVQFDKTVYGCDFAPFAVRAFSPVYHWSTDSFVGTRYEVIAYVGSLDEAIGRQALEYNEAAADGCYDGVTDYMYGFDIVSLDTTTGLVKRKFWLSDWERVYALNAQPEGPAEDPWSLSTPF